jgi:hypothetical protein
MNAIVVCAIIVSAWAPDFAALDLRGVGKDVILPRGAEWQWDAIGIYRLKAADTITTIKLYYQDSDCVAVKQQKRDPLRVYLGTFYPNTFSIHAVYRQEGQQWKHKELWRRGRVGFLRVAVVKSESVTVEVRSKHIIFSGDPIETSEEVRRQIGGPVPLQLTLKNGAPSLE